MSVPEFLRHLSIVGLSKNFGLKKAVSDLSFCVEAGNAVGLLGPNGSGKTSTLACIVGIVQPTCGTIHICGYEHDDVRAKDRFGFLSDDLPMPDSLTGRELLSFYQRLRTHYDMESTLRLLEIMDLTAALSDYFSNYSQGMKRKFQLALILGHHPELLILDEPMRGLDPESALLMRAVIHDYRKSGRAVLMATHDLSAASSICDQVIIMSHGKLLLQGDPSAITTEHSAATLEEVFIAVTGSSATVEEKTAALNALLSNGILSESEKTS